MLTTISRTLKVAAACSLFSLSLGMSVGNQIGWNRRARVDREGDHTRSRIIAWIVERNPEATIKDFQRFPETLLEAAARAEVDYRIILAVADKESQMRPRAVGANGEIGLMQLLPATAALVAKRLEDSSYEPPVRGRAGQYASLGSLADPTVNVRYGIEYLRWQVERFDGVNATALRAYNRRPENAREHRPTDRYAEDVALKFLSLSATLRQ